MATFPSRFTSEVVENKLVKRKRTTSNPSKPSGFYMLDSGTIAIGALTSYDVDEDHIRIFQFPKNTHLVGPLSVTFSDWDSGAAGEWTIKAVTAAGVETSLSGTLTTVPRAAGVVELVPSATAGISVGVDVSEQWLVIECDTAPNVAPGSGATVRAKAAIFVGGLVTLA
jgi:hypothetical protein